MKSNVFSINQNLPKKNFKPKYNLSIDWSFSDIDNEVFGIKEAINSASEIAKSIASFLILMRENEFIDNCNISLNLRRKCIHVNYNRLDMYKSYTLSLKNKLII